MNNKVEFEWIDASIEPDNWIEPVLCLSDKNKLLVLKDTFSRCQTKTVNGKPTFEAHSNWSFIREKYHITHWVYQNNLINRE